MSTPEYFNERKRSVGLGRCQAFQADLNRIERAFYQVIIHRSVQPCRFFYSPERMSEKEAFTELTRHVGAQRECYPHGLS